MSAEEGNEKGNILIMFLLTLGCVLLVLGFALEIGTVYAVHCTHDSDVAIAREQTLENGFGLRLKSSDDPARALGDEAVASLRANACTGKVTIYFYEVGPSSANWSSYAASSKSTAVRAMAYVAVLDTPWNPAVFSEGVFGGLHLTSKTSCALTPYAPKETYKPSATASTSTAVSGSSTASTDTAGAKSSYNSGRVQVLEYAARTSGSAGETVTARDLPESDMTGSAADSNLKMLKAAVDAATKQANELW